MLPRLALWALRDGRDPNAVLANIRALAATFREAVATDDGMHAIGLVIRYFGSVTHGLTREHLTTTILEIAPEAEETVTTIAQELKEKGRAEGRAEGRADALRTTLRRLLSRRFGDEDSEVDARIAAANADRLEAWIERVLDARSLSDVFDG